MILGSGLGTFVNSMKKTVYISYSDIPQYPQYTVSDHSSEWVFGYINNKPLLCVRGRFHYYESLSMEEVTLPVSIVRSLGCKSLIITNGSWLFK